MHIAITCNLKPEPLPKGCEEEFAEHDTKETIDELKSAIEFHGHTVSIINVTCDIEHILKEQRSEIDLIFNVAEGISGADREAQVPKICEQLNIPFTAAGSQTCLDTLDKARSKIIMAKSNIPTPRFQVFKMGDEQIELRNFPVIVKPTLEGSSKGIHNDSYIEDETQLRKIVMRTLSTYHQPVIVEEFLPGREFTIAVIGHKSPLVLPIVEVTFDHLPADIRPFDSMEVKWIYDDPRKGMDSLVCPAKIPPQLQKVLEETALKTFKAFDCRDWARMDLRLDHNGVPSVLDINALPGFVKDPLHNSRLPRAAYALGWTYEQLIGEVLKSARERYKL